MPHKLTPSFPFLFFFTGDRFGFRRICNLHAKAESHIAQDIADLFPSSQHVATAGLLRGDDDTIWDYAAAGDFVILTKDDDFRQRSFLRGPPPKVIWLRLGNCATSDVVVLLRERERRIVDFLADPQAALLVLRAGAA